MYVLLVVCSWARSRSIRRSSSGRKRRKEKSKEKEMTENKEYLNQNAVNLAVNETKTRV